MITISILLSSLSTIALILAIIFEGKLKHEREKYESKKSLLKSFYLEIKKLSLIAWFLILLGFFTNIGNGFLAIRNINDSKNQYVEDTLRYSNLLKSSYNVNEELKKKRLIDSLRISDLMKITRDNGLKSDSIKLAIVDNAIKALNEQRNAIEKENENIFSHFQSEVKDNIRKIFMSYEKEHIKGFSDTAYFISTRLNNEYTKKYTRISSHKLIIDYLMETSEVIDRVNDYADAILTSESKSKEKKQNIRTFLTNVEVTQNRLFSIYSRIINLKSYKQYELNNFDDFPILNRDSIKEILVNEFIFRSSEIMK